MPWKVSFVKNSSSEGTKPHRGCHRSKLTSAPSQNKRREDSNTRLQSKVVQNLTKKSARWRTDFDEQVTYLDVVRNAKSFDKVIRRDGRPVVVDGYHQHFAGKLVVKRRHATVERQHAAAGGRTDLRISGSEIRVDRRHDSALEYREYRRGIWGNWSMNQDSRGGGGAGDWG